MHIAFKKEGCTGLRILTTLLRCYALYNPPISYLQGMNDLFVPIILSFFPFWSEDGDPLESDGGAPLSEDKINEILPQIFWCYDAMLRNINHLKMIKNVTEECQNIAVLINDILSQVSPVAEIWIQQNLLTQLLWMYSDFVLLFKRTYDDIWPLWIQANTADEPTLWMSYFVTASVLVMFEEIAAVNDPSIPTVMSAYPGIVTKHNIIEIGKVADSYHIM